MHVLQDQDNRELVQTFVESSAGASQRHEDASAILRALFS